MGRVHREGLELFNIPEGEREFGSVALQNNLQVVAQALALPGSCPNSEDPLMFWRGETENGMAHNSLIQCAISFTRPVAPCI